jgi:hypothetical protein
VSWQGVVGLGALYGVGFCVPFAALLVIGTHLAPDAMIQDYPPAIQARHGPKSERGRRVSNVMGVIMAALFLAVCIASTLHLATLNPTAAGGTGFWDGFWFGVAFMVTVDVIDLVVFDWLVFCTIRPRFAVVPGTEGMPEYRDYLFHLRVLVPRPVPWPLVLIPAFGVIVGGLSALTYGLT